MYTLCSPLNVKLLIAPFIIVTFHTNGHFVFTIRVFILTHSEYLIDESWHKKKSKYDIVINLYEMEVNQITVIYMHNNL